MCVDPIVIDPPGFDLRAAWDSCKDAQENLMYADGEVNWGNAFAADPGATGCPKCHEYHWAWGKRHRCTKCAFEYPVGWNHIVGKGGQDRGTLPLPTRPPAKPDDPYYMHGWRNPGLSHDERNGLDWHAIVASFVPWVATPEESAAIATALRGDCKHYRGTREETCAAGINLRQLVGGDDYGWCTRLPCMESFRNRPNGPTACCGAFALPTPAEIAVEEAEHRATVERFTKVFPLVKRIKDENKKKSAKGVASCPACNGQIHWTHAGYNGHVHLKCETKDCISFME